MKGEQLIEKTNSPVARGKAFLDLCDGVQQNLYLLEVLNDYLMNLANEAAKEGRISLSLEEANRISYFVGRFCSNVQNIIDEVDSPAASRRAGRICAK